MFSILRNEANLKNNPYNIYKQGKVTDFIAKKHQKNS